MTTKKEKDDKTKEFMDLFDALFDKIMYYGQVDDILFRALDYKIREVAADMIVDHEKEYHGADRAKKGFN